MAGLNHAGERGNMISQYKNVAFYGNYDADYVYAIDLNNMSLITTIATEIGPNPRQSYESQGVGNAIRRG